MSQGITQLQKKNLTEFKRLSESLFRQLIDALNSMDTYTVPTNLSLKTLQFPMGTPHREDIDLPTFDYIDGLLQNLYQQKIPFFDTPRSESSYYLLMNGVPNEEILDDAIKRYQPKCLMIGIGDVHLFAKTLDTIDWEQKIADFQRSGGTVIFITESDPVLIIDNAWRMCRIHNPTQIDNFTAITLGDPSRQKLISSQIAQTLMLSITQLGFFHDECVMLWNTYKNRKAGKVSAFLKNTGSVSDTPVFVVASGPSLENDIDFIHEQQSKAIILSVASALRPLLDNGITPDFHIELENVYITPKLIELSKDYDLSSIRLVAAAAVEPEVLDYFDHAILYAREALSSYPIFASGMDETLSLPGPTAGNAALSFALECGFTDVYLFGLDLGTRDPSRHHIRGSYYDTDDALEHPDEYNIPVPGNFCKTVWTSRAFLSALKNANDLAGIFQERAKVRNCSDGARLTHVEPYHGANINLGNGSNKNQTITSLCKTFNELKTSEVNWPSDEIIPELKKLFLELRSILTDRQKIVSRSYEKELLAILKLTVGYRDTPSLGADITALFLIRGTILAAILFMERYRNRVCSEGYSEAYAGIAAKQFEVFLSELEETTMDLFDGLEPQQPVTAEKRIASSNRSLPASYRIPRNAECPCGSGKKFKRCHGKAV